MERYCTTIGQSKLLLSLGYKEETADLYYIPKVGGYFISEDKAPNSIPAWSLPRLIELMPESFDFEDWELTIWKGGCVQYLWNRSGRERLSEDYIWGDCDMEEIGTGYVANCVKCLKWVKENDYVPNIPWKEDDFIKREVWLRVSFKKAVREVSDKYDYERAREAYAVMTECGQTLEETDAELAQEISDLMDEYGKNELGLSEGWWADQGDAESILVKLNEKRYEGK